MSGSFALYTLARSWEAEEHSGLLDLTRQFGGSFILVSHSGLSAEGYSLLGSLDPFLVYKRRAEAWPGTRLLGGTAAEIHKFSSTEDSLTILRHAARSIWDWSGPRFPEDLSFLRPSGTPWFISTTHETDAFFKLVEGELDKVKAVFGDDLVRQCDDQCPDESY